MWELFPTSPILSQPLSELCSTSFIFQLSPFNPSLCLLLPRLVDFQSHPIDYKSVLTDYIPPPAVPRCTFLIGCSLHVFIFLHACRTLMFLLLLKLHVHHSHFHPTAVLPHISPEHQTLPSPRHLSSLHLHVHRSPLRPPLSPPPRGHTLPLHPTSLRFPVSLFTDTQPAGHVH